MHGWLTLEKISYVQHIALSLVLSIINVLPNILAAACKEDHYFDPNTGNCDPCAPLCAVTNCSHICPNYQIPRVSSLVQSDVPNNNASLGKGYFVIIIALSVIGSAIFGFTLYKLYQKRKCCFKGICEFAVTTDPIQIAEPGIDLEEEQIPINTNIEHV